MMLTKWEKVVKNKTTQFGEVKRWALSVKK